MKKKSHNYLWTIAFVIVLIGLTVAFGVVVLKPIGPRDVSPPIHRPVLPTDAPGWNIPEPRHDRELVQF